MRAMIYTRVSLDATGEGRSVARQEEACRALALARGWTVVGVESDNSISAYGEKARPAWERVLAAVDAGEVDVVIAWHLDRMTRSVLELERLILTAEKRGVGVATATGDIDLTTDTGRMVARILSAVARAEVERKAARQRFANAQRASEGKPMLAGIRAFGYAANGLDVVEEEAALIRQGAKAVLDGETIASVARAWTDSGLLSPWGRRRGSWSPQGVRDALLSPRYAGRRVYRGQDVGEGAWEAILDESTHLALRVALGRPPSRRGGGRVPTTLLSGLARCGVCGERVKAARNRGKPVYRCASSRACASVDRQEADIEVAAWMIERLSLPDALAELTPDGDEETEKARVEAVALRERLDVLAEAFALGEISRAQLTAGSTRLREALDAAEGILAASGTGKALEGLAGAEDAVEAWETATLARQCGAVGALVEVVVLPRTKEARGARMTLAPRV